jgi:hypothetical protein
VIYTWDDECYIFPSHLVLSCRRLPVIHHRSTYTCDDNYYGFLYVIHIRGGERRGWLDITKKLDLYIFF